MYDELSLDSANYQAPKQSTAQAPDEMRLLENLVSPIFLIAERHYNLDERVAVGFVGQLKLESSQAFELLDAQLKPLNYLPQFSNLEGHSGKHQILIFRERPNPQPRRWWINAVLLVLTLFSTMWAGAGIDGVSGSVGDIIQSGDILRGWVYTACVMLILGSHELGHYFAARYHNIHVTLPYFIPLPIGIFGTMGAFIQQLEPPRNRRQLFDIGISGPLAGLVFAVPILIIGSMTADVNPLPTAEDCAAGEGCGYILEGNSIFYASVKYAIHGEWLPTEVKDMTLNQMAFAGWTGLFVTALNLVPVGQFDGGHVLYTLLGPQARKAYLPVLVGVTLLAFMNSAWFIWVIMLFFMGRTHNIPLDDITDLDKRRRLLGILTLACFFLIFTPNPMTFVTLN